ncbi:MAG: hypothetical protein GY807_23480 [Gammaproteobacteria bacterium]|nr:hypothetical protein [Gammaproteobacteria bacterium]
MFHYPWRDRLFDWIATLWRLHDYDFDNVQLLTHGKPIDPNITHRPKIALDFRAYCRHCGKGIPVNRLTFNNPHWRYRLFCHRNPLTYEVWKDQQKERAQELAPTPHLQTTEESSHADDS